MTSAEAADKVADASVAYWKLWDRFVQTPWNKSTSWQLTKSLSNAEAKLRKAMEAYEKARRTW